MDTKGETSRNRRLAREPLGVRRRRLVVAMVVGLAIGRLRSVMCSGGG